MDQGTSTLTCPHPASALRRRLRARDYVTGDLFDVGECGACRLVVTSPAPLDGTPYYPAAYYGQPEERRFPSAVERLQRFLYARRAAAVARLAGGPGRVLDVGCGRGFLLDAFRRRGWRAHGTELGAAAAAHARERLGLEVHAGPLASAGWPPGHFDAAVMWHVLEHVGRPAELLSQVHALLRPGGALLVATPNFGSPEARLGGAGWFHLDVPRHVVHFTPGSLRDALERAGFEIRRWSFSAPEYDLFSAIQTAENALGLEPNLLYRLLRRTESRDTARRRPLEALACASLALPLGAVALPWVMAASLARAGASMSALCVKPA